MNGNQYNFGLQSLLVIRIQQSINQCVRDNLNYEQMQ
jgi:hypothetical protein